MQQVINAKQKNMLTKRTFVLCMIILFLIIIFCEHNYFNLFSDAAFSEIYTADGREYLDATESLFNQFQTHPTRPIGFPILLKSIYLLGNGEFDYRVFLSSQLFLWFATSLAIFLSVSKLKSNLIAFIAAASFLLLPGTTIRCLQIMTEPFYACLLASFALFLILGLVKNKTNYVLISWIILVFSVLVRPTLFYAVIVVLAWFAYYFYKNKKISQLLICLSIPILFIGSQARLMSHLTNEYKLSYIADITTYYYFSAYIIAAKTSQSKGERDTRWTELKEERKAELGLVSPNFSRAVLEKKDWQASSKKIREIVKSEIIDNPRVALAVYLRGFLQNSTGGNDNLVWINRGNSTFTKALYWLSRVQNLIFTLLFFIAFLSHLLDYKRLRTGLWQAKSIIILVILNLILTDPISFAQGDRFRVVIFPLILILFFTQKKHPTFLKWGSSLG